MAFPLFNVRTEAERRVLDEFADRHAQPTRSARRKRNGSGPSVSQFGGDSVIASGGLGVAEWVHRPGFRRARDPRNRDFSKRYATREDLARDVGVRYPAGPKSEMATIRTGDPRHFPLTPFTVHDSRFQETSSLAPFRSEDVNLAQRRCTPKMSSAKHQTKHDTAASTAVGPRLRRRILTETTYAGIHETPNTSRTYLQAAHGAEARVK